MIDKHKTCRCSCIW